MAANLELFDDLAPAPRPAEAAPVRAPLADGARHLSTSSGLHAGARYCGAPRSEPAVHFTLTPDAWLAGRGPVPLCPACVAIVTEA